MGTLKHVTAWRVTFKRADNEFQLATGVDGAQEKYPCQNGSIIVITDNPQKIFRTFVISIIFKVEQLEPGYVL